VQQIIWSVHSLFSPQSLQLFQNTLAEDTHIGTVQISATLTLTNVLCVPSFSFNLISVSKLISVLRCCLIFIAEYCFIQQLLGWKMIGLGKERGGLYHLMLHELAGFSDSSVSVTPIKPHFNSVLSDSVVSNSTVSDLVVSNSDVHKHFNSAVNTVNVSANVWHSRLGHLSDSRMHLLNHVIPGCSSISNKECSVCSLAKQLRLPFPTIHILLIPLR
jgi:hypothetical protein